MFGAALL
jgi:hypothetical protein